MLNGAKPTLEADLVSTDLAAPEVILQRIKESGHCLQLQRSLERLLQAFTTDAGLIFKVYKNLRPHHRLWRWPVYRTLPLICSRESGKHQE